MTLAVVALLPCSSVQALHKLTVPVSLARQDRLFTGDQRLGDKKRKCASLYLLLQVRGRATCTVLAELLRGSSLPMGEDGFRVKSIGRAA